MNQLRLLALVLVTVLVVVGPFLIVRSAAHTLAGMCLMEPVLPSRWIVDNLSSSDAGLLMNALIILERRWDPAGKVRAERLLAHDDNRVCFYATLYLASVGYEDSVPWLIRALKHLGLGILLTDHNVRETLEITDRAYIMAEGRVLIAGNAQELTTDPRARELYLGETFRL